MTAVVVFLNKKLYPIRHIRNLYSSVKSTQNTTYRRIGLWGFEFGIFPYS